MSFGDGYLGVPYPMSHDWIVVAGFIMLDLPPNILSAVYAIENLLYHQLILPCLSLAFKLGCASANLLCRNAAITPYL
jgi:hypothetical protein